MSRQAEDYNAFNSWDSFGASLMLGIVPAIMNYVFTDPHDEYGSIFIAFLAVLISLGILAVSLITRWRIIGTIINIAGCILTPLYVAIAAYCWMPEDEPPSLPEASLQQSPLP